MLRDMFLVVVGVTVALVFGWVRKLPLPLPQPEKKERKEAKSPYRTPGESPQDEEQSKNPLPPKVILPFSNPMRPTCPACNESWQWHKDKKLCACKEALEPHFHQTCDRLDSGWKHKYGGDGRRGCGYAWISLWAGAGKPKVEEEEAPIAAPTPSLP